MLRSYNHLFAKPPAFIRIPQKHAPDSANKAEEKKKIIQTSIWVALRRCLVHLLPLTASVTILTLNAKGYYIGADFSNSIHSETINLLLLQIAAKAQELFVVASLTTIIFHIARQELLFGGGLPLGLIGSGLLFGNFGYFFSMEFLGSLRYKSDNKWRKGSFLTVLILAGLTAALAGPSSATLLVPKSQDWQAGGTSFYLNGNMDDFWPTTLGSDRAANQPYCLGQNATKYGVCPSGGFHSLWEHYGQFRSSSFQIANVTRPYAKELSGSAFYWSIDSPLSQVPPIYVLGGPRSDENVHSYTFLIQPHAATAIMLQQITTDWWKALLSQTKHRPNQIDDRVSQTTVLNPSAQVRCSAPQNMSINNADVMFPTLSSDGWVWGASANFSVDTLNNTASDHLRFQWVHLPNQFGPATIGSVFETAWNPDNSSRVVVGCTVFSTYSNATLFTDEYSFWSGWYPWNIEFGHRYPANGHITVNDTWLGLLTPPTSPDGPGYYSWQPSTIESIMVNAGLQDSMFLSNGSSLAQAWQNEDLNGVGKTILLETIICNVIVDGLSRSGSDKVYNTTGPVDGWTLSGYDRKVDFDTRILKAQDSLTFPDSPSADVTTLQVSMKITGFAYQGSLTEYLAMTVLLAHIVFALSHTFWLLFTRETSDSWDSVSKIITLAQNSRLPVGILDNTSAGIDHFKTYSRRAKIRAVQPPGHKDFDHVEMIFLPEDDDDNIESQELLGVVNGQLLDISANDSSTQEPVSKQSTNDLHFNNQHHHPSTWPRNDSSSVIITDPRLLTGKNSTASLLSQKKIPSVLENTRPVKYDCKYD